MAKAIHAGYPARMQPIEDILPHRSPFLFLDEIVEIRDETVHARRTLRPEESYFLGHYPGRPVMPGVLLVEAMLQAGCYLMGMRAEKETHAPRGIPVVARLEEAKFRKMVRPGDTLDIHVTYDRETMGVCFMSGTVRVEQKVAASVRFAVTFAKDDPA